MRDGGCLRLAILAASLAIAAAGSIAMDPGPAQAGGPFLELGLIRSTVAGPAPEFTVPVLGSSPLRLADLKGQVVFLNFWATWCPPCKAEMPAMERLYGRHKSRGFTILAVSIDSGGPAPVARFVKALGLTFTVGLDPRSEVASQYRVLALPTTWLIDRTGHTAAIAIGPRDWDSAVAHAVIESLLERTGP